MVDLFKLWDVLAGFSLSRSHMVSPINNGVQQFLCHSTTRSSYMGLQPEVSSILASKTCLYGSPTELETFVCYEAFMNWKLVSVA